MGVKTIQSEVGRSRMGERERNGMNVNIDEAKTLLFLTSFISILLYILFLFSLPLSISFSFSILSHHTVCPNKTRVYFFIIKLNFIISCS